MARRAQLRWETTGLVLLGAGRAARFGSDKLAEPLLGTPLIRHTAAVYANLPFARRVAVVSPATPALTDLGYTEFAIADDANLQSGSLAEGVRQLGNHGLAAILVALADMPLVSAAHLEALRLAFGGERIVCSALGLARCPPALFPIAAYSMLTAQNGDRGARNLLAGADEIAADQHTLLDVDSPDDLLRAAAILLARG